MQSIELSGSFIIGGLLLLAISGLFYFYIDFSGAKRINEITKVTTIELQEVIDYDFNKIGYKASNNAVSSVDSHSIMFNADLDNLGTVETVSYSFSDNRVTRLVTPGNQRFVVPSIADFNIECYDSTNAITNTPADVKSVNVKILFDGEDLIADSNFFATSYFEETYFIRN